MSFINGGRILISAGCNARSKTWYDVLTDHNYLKYKIGVGGTNSQKRQQKTEHNIRYKRKQITHT
jgi:hypothetical protein